MQSYQYKLYFNSLLFSHFLQMPDGPTDRQMEGLMEILPERMLSVKLQTQPQPQYHN